MTSRTHYDNLQVKETASPEVIKGAYKHLSQKWHPDKHPRDQARAERNLQIINRAYEVLSDPEQRRAHDEWIASQQASHGATPVFADSAVANSSQTGKIEQLDDAGASAIELTKLDYLISAGPGVIYFASEYLFWMGHRDLGDLLFSAAIGCAAIYLAALLCGGLHWLIRREQSSKVVRTARTAAWVITGLILLGTWAPTNSATPALPQSEPNPFDHFDSK